MKTLTIIGRRWFQRTYGNTYHTATVLIDGKPVGTSKVTYGYGSHYEHTAACLLQEAGIMSSDESPYRLREWAHANGYNVASEAADVKRKRDL